MLQQFKCNRSGKFREDELPLRHINVCVPIFSGQNGYTKHAQACFLLQPNKLEIRVVVYHNYMHIITYDPSNIFARRRFSLTRNVTEYAQLKLGNIR